ncbi:MAG TPA: four helix bundle protein [Vicinamibacterales bacterium]|nr:four helix bundle protein [Vicinamibacterales bacterium]
MAVTSYKVLIVWQKSMALSRDVEELASRLPPHHRFALALQLRRSSSSISFNIAEGQQRTTRAYIQHLIVALGSEAELQSQLRLIANSRLASPSEVDPLLDRASEIGRMLRGLVRSLREHLRRDAGP